MCVDKTYDTRNGPRAPSSDFVPTRSIQNHALINPRCICQSSDSSWLFVILSFKLS